MLKVKDLVFEPNGEQILKGINFNFEKGKFYCITGHNGAGKSTLAKCLMGLCESEGEIFLNGKDISSKSVDERANLGLAYAFQQPVTFKGIRVFDILKIANPNIDNFEKVLKKVGLNPQDYLWRELNNSLSGGELKRIELASVLNRDFKVGIFDEPEAGIDIWSFSNLSSIFNELKSAERIIIAISHQEKVMQLADEIIVMKNGQIDFSGPTENVLKHLKNTN